MIQTERLNIRPLSYYELLSRVYSHFGHVKTHADAEKVFEYTLKPMKDKTESEQLFYTFWIGCDKEAEVLECGFLRPPTEHGVIEIWVMVRDEFQDKGYGTEAIKGLTKWASGKEEVKHICAEVAKDNFPSQRMLQKNGFEYITEVNNQNVFNLQIKS